MPTYEYHCATCDRSFDVVQSFTDDPLTSCPTCGSPVRKVFSSVGIVFKGSGFYKTDSRDSKSTTAPRMPKKGPRPPRSRAGTVHRVVVCPEGTRSRRKVPEPVVHPVRVRFTAGD